MSFPSRRTIVICLVLSFLCASVVARRKQSSSSTDDAAQSSSFSLFSLSTTFYAAVVLIAFAVFKSKTSSKYHGKRRLSNMSQILMRGFPEKLKFPANVIYGLWEFETLPSNEALRSLVDKLYLFERFRSIVSMDEKEVRLTPREADAKPTYEAHIVHHTVSTFGQALEKVESLIQVPFDLAHPVWDLHVVQNTSGNSLVIFRVHHVVGDGLGMVDVISTLITDKDGNPAPLPSFGKFDTAPKAKAAPTFAERIDFAKRFLSALAKVLNTPVSTPDTLTPFRPELNQPFSGRRRLVMIPAISLDDIKKVKNAAQATVNDVVSSLVAGAMRRYLEYRNDASVTAGSKPVSMRALLPFGFPRKVDPSNRYTALRNLWTFISLSLPVDIPGDKPLERLRATKQRMDAIKQSPEAYISRGATDFAAKVLPLAQQQQTTYEVLQRHSCVFTNVPGPTELVYFGGQPIKAIHPVFVNMIPQISVFSYNGFLRGNLVVDPEVVTEPDRFANMFLDELKDLKSVLKVE